MHTNPHDDSVAGPPDGIRQSTDSLFQILLPEVRRIVERRFRPHVAGHSWQPTDLLDEVYLRLKASPNLHWDSRAGFLKAASLAVQHALINHARDKRALKRGGAYKRRGESVLLQVGAESEVDVLELAEALEQLEQEDAGGVQIVRMRFYLGCSDAEIAGALGLAPRTVRYRWAKAKAWLLRRLSIDDDRRDGVDPESEGG